MRALKIMLISSACAAFGLMGTQASAATTKLTIVTVDPQSVDCVFSPACDVTPTDTMGIFPADKGYAGGVRLQSRTYVGAVKSKAAGKTAYIYRIDLSHAVRGKEMHCVDSADITFGAVEKLPYGPKGALGDVFVINAGNMASIGLKSAEESRNTVSVEFASPVCPANGAYPGQSTFFFGLASTKAPVLDKMKVSLTFGGGEVDVPARVPAH